jgi:hypothetical protein
VTTDPPTVQRSLAALVDCARKHGSVASVALHVDGTTLTLDPVNAAAAPVIMGEELKDLGALVALSAIRALGGSAEIQGERLLIRLG